MSIINVFVQTGGLEKDTVPHLPPISLLLHTNHYLFPSIPNVHAVSAQTTGTVMEVYFPDGSHLPASPLLSLAHLWDDSQHISLAAICLSAFTANQTSEQPNSLMGGGLETSPAYLPALLHLFLLFPYSTSSTPSLVKTFSLLYLPSSHLRSYSHFHLSLASLAFPCSSSTPTPLPSHFLLAGCSDIFACSCERVSDVRVAHRGRGSSRAWREHTLWELPFITTSPNEQHAECNTDAITFRNSFS